MRRFLLSALSLAVASHAWAATAPVTYAVRNSGGEVVMYAPTTTYTKTISGADHTFVNSSTEITATGVTVDKLQRLGYRPDDPRVGQTINAIQQEAVNTSIGLLGSGVGASAATVLAGAAAGTPVGWGAIGIAFLVGAAGYGVTMLVQGGLQWLVGSDGLVTPPSSGSTGYSGPGEAGAMTSGGAYCEISYGGQTWSSGGCGPVIASYVAAKYGAWPWSMGPLQGFQQYFYVDNPAGNGSYTHWETGAANYWTSGAPASCASGEVYNAGSCKSAGTVAPAPTPRSAGSAVSSMPDSERTKPATPDVLARATSDLWKSAYDRNPSSVLPPQTISPSDVSNFLAQNPSLQPMGDNLASSPSPFSPTASPSSPTATSPGASTNPGTGGIVGPGTQTPTTTPTTTNPKPDLGPDPGIGAPTLEATPTAAAILAPLLGLFPDLRSYVVPSHSAECPKPSIDLWDKHLVLQEHCTVLEGVRPALYAIMAAVWLMVAVFIILAA